MQTYHAFENLLSKGSLTFNVRPEGPIVFLTRGKGDDQFFLYLGH